MMEVLNCLLILTLVLRLGSGASSDPAAGSCTLAMFSNSSAPYTACRAQFALQRNWFPDPIQGLFSYQTWNGMDGFWQNGVALETMANSMLYLNNTRYRSVVLNSYRSLEQLLLAYGPQPSYDDMAWYGLAYARIYEVTGVEKFLTLAGQILDWVWEQGWDGTVCSGGVWFDQNQEGKQTIENVQTVQLAAKLGRLAGRHQDRQRAEAVWSWVVATGLVNLTTYSVYDGVSLDTCRSAGDTRYTYTAGTAVGGLVELTKLTGNKTFLLIAHNITNNVIKTMTVDGILTEPCDKDNSCNLDQTIFKGIFMKNVKYLMDFDNSSIHIGSYVSFIAKNIASLMDKARCEPKAGSNNCHIVYLDGPPSYGATGPVFDRNWSGGFQQSRPIQQTSALDLLLAGVRGPVLCVGRDCAYDPVPPPPHHLTCKDQPCPTGQDCCEYDGEYSCCNTDQKCDDGICV